jgi:hypothetical protein
MLARVQEHARRRYRRSGHGNRRSVDRTSHSSRSLGIADLVVESGTIPPESLVGIQPLCGGPEIALDPGAPHEPIAAALTGQSRAAVERALQRPLTDGLRPAAWW